ncbi:hypothetical protein BSAF29S_01962 [Bacillus safensis subsp. safensis]
MPEGSGIQAIDASQRNEGTGRKSVLTSSQNIREKVPRSGRIRIRELIRRLLQHRSKPRASGLTYIQTLKMIIMPQALRRMVPPIVSQFISLLKDTSLAVVIALPELLHHAQILNGQSQSYLLPIFLLAAMMYFVVNFSLSILARRLEYRQA